MPLAPVVDVAPEDGLESPATFNLTDDDEDDDDDEEEDDDEDNIELVLRAFLCGFRLPDRLLLLFDETLLLLLLLLFPFVLEPLLPVQMISLLIGWSLEKADVISQSEPE